MNIGLPPAAWDDHITQLGGSLLQSRVWAEVQEAMGRTSVWEQGDGWAWCGAVRVSYGLRYLMCSYGPVAKDATAMKAALDSLLVAGRQLGADFVRVEPQDAVSIKPLQKHDAVQIADWQPRHTQVIDLLQDEAVLRSGLASGHRNLINGAERRGVKVRTSHSDDDLKLFLDMIHDTAKRTKAVFFADSYYLQLWKAMTSERAAVLYVAEAEGQPVSTALLYDWGGTRIYAHAGAYQAANRKTKASVVLVWQSILDAKAAGLKEFDLWGVAPSDDPKHPWAGLTSFKKGFGGQAREYVGTWDIPLKKAKYGVYSVYRRVRGRE